MLLLVTNRRDITIDYVIAELKRRDHSFFRLNTEQLPLAKCTMHSHSRAAWSISFKEHVVHGDEVRAAYFRRPGEPVPDESITHSGERAYAKDEWVAFLKSIYTRLEGRWLNAPTAIFLAEDKPRQLMLASEIGFNVPRAVISNDIESSRKVLEEGPAIGKPLRQALIGGEEERVIFTSRLKDLSESDGEAIALTPFITQIEIAKQYDIRVTVVGDQLFATAIWSQAHPETEVDWRRGARPDLKHERISLPDHIEQQCRTLLKRLNLRYGAIDLVCDRDGCIWFLEVNPNGQWAWIENVTGYPIACAIVDELEEIAQCSN